MIESTWRSISEDQKWLSAVKGFREKLHVTWPELCQILLFEIMVNCTNLTFLAFVWKIDIFRKSMTIIGSKVWCLSNSANLSCLGSLRLSYPCVIMLSWILKWSQVQKVKWCIKKIQFKIYSTHVWFAELDKHQTSKPVVVKCQICVIYENLDHNMI